ncbi:zinc finger C2HC domain-containing protein 1C-like [Parambassis ranga]|uniref:Zinc finger C2HC domain-containing protein 1C-like n=1 Tax=Parambassis ranga TaxID=210632 RepID=A0A6P7HIT2_9TELE|nr:zinc finger C2HC domain-containing protein 1C [Parambassis ranga]
MTVSTRPGDPQFSHSKEDSHRVPGSDLQMSREIHEKKLMLQEKLWKVEEQIRQKIQRDRAAGDDQKTREDRPERNRDMLMQDRGQRDFKQVKKRQEQQTEDYMSTIHEETYPTIKTKEQEVSVELNPSRWHNVKEHSRRKRENERDDVIWREAEKTKHNKQSKASVRDRGQTQEKIYGEGTHLETDCSVSEQDTPLKMATEHHRGKPLESNPVQRSGPQQAEFELLDSTVVSIQSLPCKICSRMFVRERLERHVQICKKLKQSHRQVYNSYAHRTKGSDLGEFLKTHTRSETPNDIKTKKRNYKGNISNLHRSQLPAGTLKSKQLK